MDYSSTDEEEPFVASARTEDIYTRQVVPSGSRIYPPLGFILDDLLDVSKDRIRDLPRFDLANDADVLIASTTQQAEECVVRLENSMEQLWLDPWGNPLYVLGFDTETKPNFQKGRHPNAVAMVQLATPTLVVLFRVCMFTSRRLCALLSNTRVVKVGVGVKQDVKALGLPMNQGFYDVEEGLRKRFPSLRRCGLRGAIASCGGMQLCKSQSTSNWEQRFLSKAQIFYAANDALAGLYLLSVVTDSNIFNERRVVEQLASAYDEDEFHDIAWELF